MLPHSRWTLAAIAALIVLLAVGTYVFWHYIVLAVIGWGAYRFAFHKLVGLPRRGRRRGSRLETARKWLETGASLAIARNTKGLAPRPERIAPTPTPVYRVPSSQIAADDPRWESDKRWPFRGGSE